jgi:hypothetical protein
MRATVRAKWLITSSAVAIVIGHALFPSVKVDAFTALFLVIAVLPWFTPVVKSLELPGGFKVELREVKEAAEKVLGEPRVVEGSAHLRASSSISAQGEVLGPTQQVTSRLRAVAANDPNLTLVGAGIEIEKRLLNIAEKRGLDTSRCSIRLLLQQLQQQGVVAPTMASGISDLVALRNQAAHGASVAPEAAEWVISELPAILATLDRLAAAT